MVGHAQVAAGDPPYGITDPAAFNTDLTRHGLDPLEIVNAANLGYPRPDLCKPGYVGGACLSKDPYLMIDGAATPPFLVGRARALNEYLPIHVANTVVTLLADECGTARGRRLAVLGWAYKGWPPTDDMRGTPITAMMPVFDAAGLTVLGHDPLVAPEVIARYGGEPVSLDKAFADADAVLIVIDHPDYRALPVDTVLAAGRPRLVYDSWRILDEAAVTAHGVRYAGIGYTAAGPVGATHAGPDRVGPHRVGPDRVGLPGVGSDRVGSPAVGLDGGVVAS